MEFTFQNNAQFSALHLALEYTGNSYQNNFMIFTDSKSCLQAMEVLKTDRLLVDCMLTKADHLNNHFFSIVFCWVLGHLGLSGNE